VTDVLTYVASPAWAYVALWALLAVDAFLPVVPTQAIMITSGALTVYGGLDLSATIAVGAVGVLTGDLGCYLLGQVRRRHRGAGFQFGSRVPAVARRIVRRAAGRLVGGLRRPGPVVILLCRFVPGGRMAAGYSAGRGGYSPRRFLVYAAIAASAWATYGGMVGYLGGTAVTQSAWRLLGVAAVAATVFAAAGWALALTGPRQPARDGAGTGASASGASAGQSGAIVPRATSAAAGGAQSPSRSMSCRAASVTEPDSDG
jgi:membrane protein DedA with SNARE-associated domain